MPIPYSAVPYVASWSEEDREALPRLVERFDGQGIAYPDEILADRDSLGILWDRVTVRRGHGKPQFANVHPLRQRRAMRKLLCQVCGEPADTTDDGVLWIMPDKGETWPESALVGEPPICLPCLRLSVRLCPALRTGHVVLRASVFSLYGIDGIRYRPSRPYLTPVGEATLPFHDPGIHWTLASKLVRELRECDILEL